MLKKLVTGLGVAWIGSGVLTLLLAQHDAGSDGTFDLSPAQKIAVVAAGPLTLASAAAEEFEIPVLSSVAIVFVDAVDSLLAAIGR